MTELSLITNKIQSCYEIEKVLLSSRLVAVIFDSDPYDKIMYQLDGKFIASEHVANYKVRITEVKDNLDLLEANLEELANRQ